jgi:hypothetical protein
MGTFLYESYPMAMRYDMAIGSGMVGFRLVILPVER